MKKTALSLMIIPVLLSGCNNDSKSASESSIQNISTNNEVKSASKYTVSMNDALYKTLPFANKTDFENAKKGFIAPLPNNGVVKDAKGNVVWDLGAYLSYIKEGTKSPDTVNPSLWRQAELLMYSGLFEVVPGVYQVRGADLSNMTIVEGEKGITIFDPLVSAETAKYALDLYYQHRPKKPVVAVVITHSHVDHFGGIRGVVSEADVKSGKVHIYAPEGFTMDAVAENVMAGTAMSRRASYMYGNLLPKSPEGQVTAGLGITTSSGEVTLIKPTDLIQKTGETRTIDGLKYIFVMAPGSEAPSEMMWYMPQFKMVNTAEDSSHTMHNLYSLRGAKTRDAQKWPGYLNDVLRRFGGDVQVEIAMHHWPTWGNENVVKHIESQRDLYKTIHDQTLHFANMGYTMNELPDMVKLPKALIDDWSSHGYYGSKSHNVRAVYNFYLGYFNGNPADLNPLPPEQEARDMVDAFGKDKMMQVGYDAIQKGKYRWAATVLKQVVFADPKNQDAKNLLADALEQMGYQAESGPWRDFYLTGASELRKGVQELPAPNTASPDIIANMTLDQIFAYMGVELDVDKAKGKDIVINWQIPDTKEKHTLFLKDSVLNEWADYQDPKADVTVSMDRKVLNEILSNKMTYQQAIKSGDIKVDGDTDKFLDFVASLDDLNQHFWFNIVTP
ncbi:alkyl/aryl-sulfatase [Hydrogenovibrio marinus]|uniref:Metallo-beta-lactamase domain-containing protein n=1 Tax=Hydrogenovibrio marinus TaxID=28885 RepID=A0A066ZY18_HYDMR|nr:alkyl sulfatase dimerization domain-containing protein [Hydrogenovibrio marinus]KDN95020.1 hypothetical protein EI16_01535 [Hydrogenovibrio marinus]BBN59486.1 alkyl sulfatase [Hydrogenovibrio marinus]